MSNSGGKDSTGVFLGIHDAVAFKMLPALYVADVATEPVAAGAAAAASGHARESEVAVESERERGEAQGDGHEDLERASSSSSVGKDIVTRFKEMKATTAKRTASGGHGDDQVQAGPAGAAAQALTPAGVTVDLHGDRSSSPSLSRLHDPDRPGHSALQAAAPPPPPPKHSGRSKGKKHVEDEDGMPVLKGHHGQGHRVRAQVRVAALLKLSCVSVPTFVSLSCACAFPRKICTHIHIIYTYAYSYAYTHIYI